MIRVGVPSLLFIGALTLSCTDTTEPIQQVPLAGQALTVSPSGVALVGSSAVDTFRVLYETGTPVRPDSINWRSLNPTIASIDPQTGEVRGFSAGQAIIVARSGSDELGYGLVTVSMPSTPPATWSVDTLTKSDLRAIWSTGNELFAVGAGGAVIHYDGSAWHAQNSGVVGDLTDVFGISPTDVYAVGGYYDLVHYDGSSWSEYHGSAPIHPRGVWAASPTQLVIVGDDGLVQHEGDNTRHVYRNGNYYQAVWGSSPDDIWAVGTNGVMLHYDGTDWNDVESGTGLTLQVIWGTGPDDIYAGGLYVLLHYDGTAWTDISSQIPTQPPWVRGLSGSSPTDVVGAADWRLLHFDGTEWTSPRHNLSVPLVDITVSASGTAYGVGVDGTVATGVGGNWTTEQVGVGTTRVNGIWAQAPGETYPLFAVGDHGMFLHRVSNGSWQQAINYRSSDPRPDLQDVWGTREDNVLAVGSGGEVLFNRGSTAGFLAQVTGADLYGIWGASEKDIFVVGDGVILHYDGKDLEVIRDDAPALRDVWGTAHDEVFAVGEADGDGAIWHYDGDVWVPQGGPAGDPLAAVWGTAADDVFAVGGSRILHYDGVSWTAMSVPAVAGLHTVWGTSPTDVYAGGADGLLHYDGTTWASIPAPADVDYRCAWGSSWGRIYLGGTGSRILAADR